MTACPEGRRPFVCLRNLCKWATCASNPHATCRVNPCNACKVEFYDKGGHLVNCTKGVFLIHCFVNVWASILIILEFAQLVMFVFWHTCIICFQKLCLRYSRRNWLKNLKGSLHNAIFLTIVPSNCGHSLKINEIVVRDVAQVESDTTSAILRAMLHLWPALK